MSSGPIAPSDAGRPDETTIGSMLRDLHAVLRTYPAQLPPLAPLADIPAFLARRQTLRTSPSLVSDADAAVLAEAFGRLTGSSRRPSRTSQRRRCTATPRPAT